MMSTMAGSALHNEVSIFSIEHRKSVIEHRKSVIEHRKSVIEHRRVS